MAESAPTAVSESTDVADAVSGDANILINRFVDANLADGNTRRLEFQSKNLGKDVDLLLVFEPPEKAGKLYVDLFPVCWKVISLAATGTATASVVYTSQTAFIVPQVDNDNLVVSSNAQPCKPGQRCILKTNAKQHNYLTDAVSGTPKFIQCLNETGSQADIEIGYYNSSGTNVEAVFIWKHVANFSTLSVQLTPILKIYAVSDYEATEFIRGDIESPLLWKGDLVGLNAFIKWNISIDEGTGEVVIKEA